MNKNNLKDGKFYLAKNGEIYKYEENNGNPRFRVDNHTIIGMGEFDNNLKSRHPSWSIIKKFPYTPIPNDFNDEFISADGKEVGFSVIEIATKNKYRLYHGIDMFKFSDGGKGNPDKYIENIMFADEFDSVSEDDNMYRYIIVNGRKMRINLFTHCILVNKKEKRLLTKSFVKKNFCLSE